MFLLKDFWQNEINLSENIYYCVRFVRGKRRQGEIKTEKNTCMYISNVY